MPRIATLLVLYFLFASAAEAQVFQVGGRGEPAFWVTGGVGYLSQGRIHDGATQSQWDFSGGLQWRASVERAIQRESSIGITASWAQLPLRYRSLDGSFAPRDGSADVWQIIASVHAGGGDGFHQVIQIHTGIAGYSGFQEDATGEPLGPGGSQSFTLGIGYGFGYTLGSRTAITVVQDFGYVFRSRRGLPGDVGGSAQISTLRLGLRHGLGRRGL